MATSTWERQSLTGAEALLGGLGLTRARSRLHPPGRRAVAVQTLNSLQVTSVASAR